MTRRIGLALETVLTLLWASLTLLVSSEAGVPRLLGETTNPDDVPPSRPDPAARRIGRAVPRVARLLPWRPQCLPQTVAARAMLRRRGIPHECHLGVVQTTPFLAHAWVTVQGVVIVGGPVHHATRIASFS